MACWRGICRCCRSRSCNDGSGSSYAVSPPLAAAGGDPRARSVSSVPDGDPTKCSRPARGGHGNLADHYCVDDDIVGQGSFSAVRVGRCRRSGLDRAVKINAKGIKDAPDIQNEIDLLMAMDHENIIPLFETFEDQQNNYLVLELCTGGELFDRVVEVGKLSEPQAAVIMRQIGLTVCYMHGKGVVHRDLKPENFVFASKGPLESTPLKLIDFGLSRRFSPGEVLTTAVGTVLYVAPEVFSQSYSASCDLWSFGVIMYCLLCGHPPFDGKTAKQTVKSIRKGSYSLQGDLWDSVSESAKDLIRGLLTRDVAKRCTESQVLSHHWIDTSAAGSSGESLGFTVIENLQDLCEQNRRAKSLQRRHMAAQLVTEVPRPH